MTILAGVALRRFANRHSGFLRRRRRGPQEPRGATPDKGSRVNLALMAFGALFMLQGVVMATRYVERLGTLEPPGATTAVTTNGGPTAEAPTRHDHSDERLLPDPRFWPYPLGERGMRRGLSLTFVVLFVALLLTTLGNANQDLGKVDWTTEWLFSFPATARTLFAAKTFEYAFLNPFAYFSVLPMAFVALWGAGFGWNAIPLALATTVYISAIQAALRLYCETWLRVRCSLSATKNVQAACTALGIIAFYTLLYLVLADAPPDWFRATVFAVPDAIAFVPPCAPVLLLQSGASVGYTLLALAVLAVALGALAVQGAAELVRGGLVPASGPYASRDRHAALGEPRPRWLRGVLGKELRLFVRDRNFLVQTTVVPLLVIGFQMMLNPQWLDAAGGNFDHGATIAFGIGAYAVLSGGLSVITNEGQTLWLLYTFPHRIEEILRRKVALWAGVGLTYAGAVLLLLTLRGGGHSGWALLSGSILALVGVVIYASIAAGLGVLGARLHAQRVQRRMRQSSVYLYLMLASLYSYGIYASAWSSKIAIVVLCTLLACAIWQKVHDQIPFLLDPNDAPPPSISSSDGLIAALVFFVVRGLTAGAMQIASRPSGADKSAALPSLTISQLTIAFVIAGVVTLGGYLAYFAARRIPNLMAALGLAEGADQRFRAPIPYGIALGLPAAALGIGYLQLLEHWPALQGLGAESPLLGADGPNARWWMAGLAVVAAPLVEELLFRGILFRGLRRSFRAVWAVLASAAVFAIVHPPVSWIPVFGLGVITALAVERTRSVWSAVLVHAIYNATVITAAS